MTRTPQIGPLALAAVLFFTATVATFALHSGDGPNIVPAPAAHALPAADDSFASACGTTNPFFAVSVMARLTASGDPADVPAILAFRDTIAGDPGAHAVLATQAEVGDVYGLAYDHTRGQLYAAAYYRNGGTFGPGGPGQIYRIDVTTGAVEPWVALNAGSDPRTARATVSDSASVVLPFPPKG